MHGSNRTRKQLFHMNETAIERNSTWYNFCPATINFQKFFKIKFKNLCKKIFKFAILIKNYYKLASTSKKLVLKIVAGQK